MPITSEHPTRTAVDLPKAPADRLAFAGLLQRKERWSLSWSGRFLFFALVVGAAVAITIRVHPFLAVTNRVNADVLVVEGWLPNYGLEESITEFHAGHYRLIMTVGGEILSGTNIDPGDNLASNAAARLKWLGLEPQFVRAAPSPVKYRDRTFASAAALKQWFETNHESVNSFNLVTLGPHARRSRLLFEKAFQGTMRVGIISIQNREYDPHRWWKSSEGVKETISEALAYCYARLFFVPAEESKSATK